MTLLPMAKAKPCFCLFIHDVNVVAIIVINVIQKNKYCFIKQIA